MRPILALAVLLVGLRGAAPETKYPDSLPAIGATALPSSFDLAAPIGKSDRNFGVALPALESSDVAHDQSEETVRPLQSPASTVIDADTNADAAVADSLEGLCNALMRSAQDNGLPVAFFANLIWQESRLRHDAVSRVGAQGIAQFMPEVAIEIGVADPFDPQQAIPASARLLHILREHFGNLGFVAAAYNAGAHRVGEWLDHRRALPRQTRTYVLRVTGRSVEAWRKAPVEDSKLTFVQRLPCRELPAFADLAQAQLRDTQTETAQQAQPQPKKPVAKAAAKTSQQAARQAHRKPLAAHHLEAERKPARQVTDKIARSGRHGRHEAAHRVHAPRGKHKVA